MTMEDKDIKNNEKSQNQSNEKGKKGTGEKLEKKLEKQSLPDLLQTIKTEKKKAMTNAIKENMKAVRKSNE